WWHGGCIAQWTLVHEAADVQRAAMSRANPSRPPFDWVIRGHRLAWPSGPPWQSGRALSLDRKPGHAMRAWTEPGLRGVDRAMPSTSRWTPVQHPGGVVAPEESRPHASAIGDANSQPAGGSLMCAITGQSV